VVVAAGTVDGETNRFNLKGTAKGIEADRSTYQTSAENIFAIGNSLRTSKLAIRSLGQGKEVASSVWQFLNGKPVKGERRMFNSRFGRLVKEEFSEYLKESVVANRNHPSKRSTKRFLG
jgi:hypothetical protein